MVYRYAVSILVAATGAFVGSGYATILLNRGVDAWHEHELRMVLLASLAVGVLFAGIAAYFAKTTSRLIVLLISFHILWVQPIWGFHHDYTIGCFAWLFLGGEV